MPGSHTHIHMQSEYRLPHTGLTSGSDLSMLDVWYAWLEWSPAVQPCIFIQSAFGNHYAPLEDAGQRPAEKSSVQNTAHTVTVPELSDGSYLGVQRGFVWMQKQLVHAAYVWIQMYSRCSTNRPIVLTFFLFLYKPFGVFCQTEIILVFLDELDPMSHTSCSLSGFLTSLTSVMPYQRPRSHYS